MKLLIGKHRSLFIITSTQYIILAQISTFSCTHEHFECPMMIGTRKTKQNCTIRLLVDVTLGNLSSSYVSDFHLGFQKSIIIKVLTDVVKF